MGLKAALFAHDYLENNALTKETERRKRKSEEK